MPKAVRPGNTGRLNLWRDYARARARARAYALPCSLRVKSPPNTGKVTRRIALWTWRRLPWQQQDTNESGGGRKRASTFNARHVTPAGGGGGCYRFFRFCRRYTAARWFLPPSCHVTFVATLSALPSRYRKLVPWVRQRERAFPRARGHVVKKRRGLSAR